MTTKELIRQTLDGSPDDVSMDACIERIYILRKIEEVLRRAADVMEHEELKRRFRHMADVREV